MKTRVASVHAEERPKKRASLQAAPIVDAHDTFQGNMNVSDAATTGERQGGAIVGRTQTADGRDGVDPCDGSLAAVGVAMLAVGAHLAGARMQAEGGSEGTPAQDAHMESTADAIHAHCPQ